MRVTTAQDITLIYVVSNRHNFVNEVHIWNSVQQNHLVILFQIFPGKAKEK